MTYEDAIQQAKDIKTVLEQVLTFESKNKFNITKCSKYEYRYGLVFGEDEDGSKLESIIGYLSVVSSGTGSYFAEDYIKFCPNSSTVRLDTNTTFKVLELPFKDIADITEEKYFQLSVLYDEWILLSNIIYLYLKQVVMKGWQYFSMNPEKLGSILNELKEME